MRAWKWKIQSKTSKIQIADKIIDSFSLYKGTLTAPQLRRFQITESPTFKTESFDIVWSRFIGLFFIYALRIYVWGGQLCLDSATIRKNENYIIRMYPIWFCEIFDSPPPLLPSAPIVVGVYLLPRLYCNIWALEIFHICHFGDGFFISYTDLGLIKCMLGGIADWVVVFAYRPQAQGWKRLAATADAHCKFILMTFHTLEKCSTRKF